MCSALGLMHRLQGLSESCRQSSQCVGLVGDLLQAKGNPCGLISFRAQKAGCIQDRINELTLSLQVQPACGLFPESGDYGYMAPPGGLSAFCSWQAGLVCESCPFLGLIENMENIIQPIPSSDRRQGVERRWGPQSRGMQRKGVDRPWGLQGPGLGRRKADRALTFDLP